MTPADVDRMPEQEPARGPILSRRNVLRLGVTTFGGLLGAVALGRVLPDWPADEPLPSPIVPVYDPEAVAWTFVVDTRRCIGCGLCVAACKRENGVPHEPDCNRTWVERHVVTDEGVVLVDAPDGGIHGFGAVADAPGLGEASVAEAFFVPRLCMQCETSPCTVVCPVGATYRTADGIILVDEDRCIGCGYCVTACPYGARYIVPAGDAETALTPGVADKCTWCYHRIARGLQPACVEVCPVGARVFGDRNDADGVVAGILRESSPQPLWPEYGTRPRVLYLGPGVERA